MTLLIVSDYAAPYAGNFICSINRLCELMTSKQDRVLFIFPTKCKELPWIKELGTRYTIHFGSELIRLVSVIHGDRVDAVYTHFCLPKTQCFAKLATRVTRIPLIQHWHNHYQKWPGLKGRLADWAFEGDMNIACSKQVMDDLPYPAEKKQYAENAIDFSRLDLYDANFKFYTDSSQKVILMFGFDYERKGVDLAIKAMMPIAEKEGLKLVVSLSQNHEKVEAKINELCGCIPDWVKIVDARDDVATYYHAADIFLSAAREEGFCYALVEAAYCGCEVISSEIDGVPYQRISHCKTFKSEDVEGLQKAILSCLNLNSAEEKNAMRNAVMKEFDLQEWARKEYGVLHGCKR